MLVPSVASSAANNWICGLTANCRLVVDPSVQFVPTRRRCTVASMGRSSFRENPLNSPVQRKGLLSLLFCQSTALRAINVPELWFGTGGPIRSYFSHSMSSSWCAAKSDTPWHTRDTDSGFLQNALTSPDATHSKRQVAPGVAVEMLAGYPPRSRLIRSWAWALVKAPRPPSIVAIVRLPAVKIRRALRSTRATGAVCRPCLVVVGPSAAVIWLERIALSLKLLLLRTYGVCCGRAVPGRRVLSSDPRALLCCSELSECLVTSV